MPSRKVPDPMERELRALLGQSEHQMEKRMSRRINVLRGLTLMALLPGVLFADVPQNGSQNQTYEQSNELS